ncbi:MAG: amidohydrolase [Dehalobacterium sp.]
MKKATKVFTNGTIVTINETNQICTCLAIDGKHILKAGSDNEVKPYITSETEIIDLKGKTMLPGFYDSHGHFAMAGNLFAFTVSMFSPPIGDKINIAQCLEALREYIKNHPGDDPVISWGFDNTLIAEKRHLTRYDLDQVATDRAILVLHPSGHLAYVNSYLLNQFGYTKDTPSPEGGVIQKDPRTGEPNGVLEETAFLNVGGLSLISSKPEQAMEAMEYISKQYAERGVTTASDGGLVDMKLINNYLEAAKNGALQIRVALNPFYEIMDEAYQIEPETDLITMAGVKFLQDGSLQGFTGYLSEPYYTPFDGDPDYRGYPSRNREKFTEMVLKTYERGYQTVVHCNGDAAMDDYLYAIRVAQKTYPRADDRPVIIHAQTARKDQIKEMKELGAFPSFFALHTYYWGDRHKEIFLGPERGSNISPAKWALEEGVTFSSHCDTPVVPQTPLLSIWALVNRKSYAGNDVGPEQRIDTLNAIKSYTIHAAYQNFEENIKGSLETGKLADLVILSENPLECDADRINDIQVLETIVGGKTVFKANPA